MSHEKFQAPVHANELFERSITRCNRLIESQIWDFPNRRLKAWYNKFTTPEEQYFCAHLLDALTYRSKEMVDSLCRHAIYSILPNNISSYPTPIETWCKDFEQGKLTNYLFVAVEGVSNNGLRETAKSGQLVLREYHRSGAVNKSLFIDAENLLEQLSNKKYINVVVFIDDFCGTGTQFSKFYNHFKLSSISSNVEQYYIPLAGHESCYEKFKSTTLNNVKVQPVEILSEEHSFFREIDGTFRGDSLNSVNTAKDFYINFLEKNNIKQKNNMGFGNLSTTYSFEFSTPNNMLPIYWTTKNGWPNLLDR